MVRSANRHIVLFAPFLPSLRGNVVFSSHLVPGHRSESLVLSVQHPWAQAPNLEELASSLVGRPCAIGWPYLNLGQIVSVVTANFTLSFSKRARPQRTDTPADLWQKVRCSFFGPFLKFAPKLCADLKTGFMAEKKVELDDILVILQCVDLQGMMLNHVRLPCRAKICV